MFARTLLAILLTLGLLTGAPAFACAAADVSQDCACCPVEEPMTCCEAPADLPKQPPVPLAPSAVDLKLALAPVLKVIGEVVERDAFQPAPVEKCLGEVTARTVFERIGIRLI
ncbi:MAG: hypothetical protein ACO1QR_14535 [Chthoniobacteraceae bacterium]